MPKQVRVPGTEPPPLSPEEEMEREIQRRVEAELAARAKAAQPAPTDNLLGPRIEMNMALPSFYDLPPAAVSRLRRPQQFREGWHVPRAWMGGRTDTPEETA